MAHMGTLEELQIHVEPCGDDNCRSCKRSPRAGEAIGTELPACCGRSILAKDNSIYWLADRG